MHAGSAALSLAMIEEKHYNFYDVRFYLCATNRTVSKCRNLRLWSMPMPNLVRSFLCPVVITRLAKVIFNYMVSFVL